MLNPGTMALLTLLIGITAFVMTVEESRTGRRAMIYLASSPKATPLTHIFWLCAFITGAFAIVSAL